MKRNLLITFKGLEIDSCPRVEYNRDEYVFPRSSRGALAIEMVLNDRSNTLSP